VEIILEAETSKIHGCGWVPDDYDDYRWSYRLLSNSNNGPCNQYQNGWTTIGTGDTQTVELSECSCRRGADWEIRVQGIDSSGNVASTDSIEFYVILNPGC